MKRGKTQGLVFIVFAFLSTGISAQNQSMGTVYEGLLFSRELVFMESVFNPTPEGYFIQNMSRIHSGMAEYGGPNVIFMDMNLQGWCFPLMAGFMIPAFNNLAIPILFERVTYTTLGNGDQFQIDSSAYMVGGGLVAHAFFGVLGVYGTYTWEKSVIWDEKAETESERRDKGWNWAILPAVNMKDFPYLGKVLSLVEGFIAFDELGMGAGQFKPSYRGNILFRNISLGGENYLSLGTFTMKDFYDYNAKYSITGVKAEFTFGEPSSSWTIGVEGGNRDFFEIEQNRDDYKDGLFMRFTLKYFMGVVGASAFFESGSKPLPGSFRIGVMIGAGAIGKGGGALAWRIKGGLGSGNGGQVAQSFDYYSPRKNH